MVTMIPFHTTRPAFTLRSISGYLAFQSICLSTDGPRRLTNPSGSIWNTNLSDVREIAPESTLLSGSLIPPKNVSLLNIS